MVRVGVLKRRQGRMNLRECDGEGMNGKGKWKYDEFGLQWKLEESF